MITRINTARAAATLPSATATMWIIFTMATSIIRMAIMSTSMSSRSAPRTLTPAITASPALAMMPGTFTGRIAATAVPHGDHIDYLVDGRLHHPHDDHCDDHGPVEVVQA